jgi:soluble lytic murein transglycosylase-like protein
MVRLAPKQMLMKTAICFAVLFAGLLLGAPSAVSAEVYYYKGADGVFRFSNTKIPGAKPFRPDGTARARAKVDPLPAAESAAPRAVRRNSAYDHIIAEYADRYGVDPALVKAVIHVESNFWRDARSRAGARGLMQLMPSTARIYGIGTKHLYEPRHNIHAGVRHLRGLLRVFKGNTRLAVAAYNAGEGAVRRYQGLPPYRETRRYVSKVLQFHTRYANEVGYTPASSSSASED